MAFTVLDVELQSSKLYLKEKIENTWSKFLLRSSNRIRVWIHVVLY
jgi:hypothetical protein